MHIHAYTVLHTHACTYTHTHAYTHTCMHIHAYTCIYTHMHAHTRIHSVTHTCMHIHAYTVLHTHACTHAYTHTCMHIRAYTHTCTYKHVHTHTHLQAVEGGINICDGIISGGLSHRPRARYRGLSKLHLELEITGGSEANPQEDSLQHNILAANQLLSQRGIHKYLTHFRRNESRRNEM